MRAIRTFLGGWAYPGGTGINGVILRVDTLTNEWQSEEIEVPISTLRDRIPKELGHGPR